MSKINGETDPTDIGQTPRNNNSYTVSDVKPAYAERNDGIRRIDPGYNSMMAGLGPGPFYPMGPMDSDPVYYGGYQQYDYHHPPHCQLEANPHYPRMSPYFPQSYYPFYAASSVHGIAYPRPTERRVSYYPFIRYGTEYQQRIVTIPIEKTRTRYVEKVYEVSYVPQAIEETVMETVAVEKVRTKVEYVPVERKIIHMPKDEKKTAIVNPEKHPELMQYLIQNQTKGGQIRREQIRREGGQIRREEIRREGGGEIRRETIITSNTQQFRGSNNNEIPAMPVSNRAPANRPFEQLNHQGSNASNQNNNLLTTNFKQSHVQRIYNSRGQERTVQ